MTYIVAESKTGYDRRYEDRVFPADTRCVECIDYIGKGGPRDENGEMLGPGLPGDYYGVAYCRAESFYRAFAQCTFGRPCIVDIGEYPAAEYHENGEAVITESTVGINMAACFKLSDIEILPHGLSRHLVFNTNDMFAGCKRLRAWQPAEMVEAGLAGVDDMSAPRILRTNGLAQQAFFYNLQPRTMKRMFQDCHEYSGVGINAISWRKLAKENSASGFAEGCHFEPHFLDAIIANIYREHFHEGGLRTLVDVNLGAGVVSGVAAEQAKALIDAGIELTGFDIVS